MDYNGCFSSSGLVIFINNQQVLYSFSVLITILSYNSMPLFCLPKLFDQIDSCDSSK